VILSVISFFYGLFYLFGQNLFYEIVGVARIFKALNEGIIWSSLVISSDFIIWFSNL